VGTARMLETALPPAQVSWALTRNLGQDLFAPPNVKGWDGGLTWITTNNLLSRYNEAAVLVEGDTKMLAGMNLGLPNVNPNMMREVQNRMARMRPTRVEPGRIFNEKERTDKSALIAALEKRLLQSKLKEKQRQALREFLDARGELDEGDILGAVRLVMSTPEYQLT
jgi:hypothetical protein